MRYEKEIHVLPVHDADPELALFFYTKVVFYHSADSQYICPGIREKRELIKHRAIATENVVVSVIMKSQKRSCRRKKKPEFEREGKRVPFTTRMKLNIGDKIEMLDKTATVVDTFGDGRGGRYKYFVVIE